MLRWILTIVQLFSAVALIGLVLLQRGKGAEAGAGFGAGASGTVFGARGATTALSRATAVLAAVFMINSLALAYMGTRPAEAPKTILDEASSRQPSVPGGTRAPAAPPAATGAPAPTATTPPAPASTPAPRPAPK
ncbi:MAG: preprotein translocase subunit SecG [Gammaproteobacteria bacterium]|nr:MAG: preprotein translocase subunit SecG [Gammaproteobacteria bacterium]